MGRSIEAIIDRVDHLHTFSSIIDEINTSISNETTSMRSIASIIERDSAISAMVLRLANSSYYGLSQMVTTMSMALSVLGLKTVKGLINTASILKIFSGAKFRIFDPRDLLLHSLGCAVCAGSLVEARSRKLKDEAFMAGLLHDIGILVLLEYDEKEMEKVCRLMESGKFENQREAEREVLGFTHMEIGARLAERWHFPQGIIDVISHHHDPVSYARSRSRDHGEDEQNSLLCMHISAANEITKALALGKSLHAKAEEIDEEVWAMLGIPQDGMDQFIFSIREQFDELRESLRFVC
jgi:putative nucleotidyltransferase with HDIG domain